MFHMYAIFTGNEWKGRKPVKFLKKLLLIIIIIGITCAGIYAVWSLILPETWLSEVKYAFGIYEDSGITGEEYTNFDTTYYPYYGFLSDDGKKLYGQVYANAIELQTTFIPIVTLTVSEVENVVKAVFHDHPELFWMDSGFSYQYTQDNVCVQIVLKFNETYHDIETCKEQFEKKAAEIIEPAQVLESDYLKEKYVYQAILDATKYNDEASVNQSAYSALVNGKTVCAGYARAFQYIMTELGIPTYYCTGMTEGHAWNIVKLENGYYNVDLTSADNNNAGQLYLNRTDASLGASHKRSGYSVLLPKCSATKYYKIEE